MATLVFQDQFEEVREREFGRLDRSGEVYVDYTGSALYPASLVRAHAQALQRAVLGNPHSENPTSNASTQAIERACADVLDFFAADPLEYTVCFTANATAAIKLVAESFRFAPASRLVLSTDNHNSVNGIREYAAKRGAIVEYIPLNAELRLQNPLSALPTVPSGSSLFAFPAQSNFSGVRHPLELVAQARERGYTVLLDAAAFVPTRRLSLRDVRPDFVPVSFYKMFGYPTGVGALLARRDALAALERPWFAGGTVDFVSTRARMHVLRPGAGAFEDGTPNFLAIPAVSDGLAFVADIGVDAISAHVDRLTQRLLQCLRRPRHTTGAPTIRVYGPTTMQERGGTVAFNLLSRAGDVIDYEHVIQAAGARRISLRGGCFCNHGVVETVFGYPAWQTRRCLEGMRDGFTLERLASCMDGAPVGAVRASFGMANNDADVDRLVDFLVDYSSTS
jgi:selenocysteine lyase/cysteine desulfurase